MTNNFAYVVMLSAAQDILSAQENSTVSVHIYIFQIPILSWGKVKWGDGDDKVGAGVGSDPLPPLYSFSQYIFGENLIFITLNQKATLLDPHGL